MAFSGCFENTSKKNNDDAITNLIKNKVIKEDLKPLNVSYSINSEVFLENVKIKTTSVVDNGYYIFGNIEKSIIIAKLSFKNKFIWIKKYSNSNELSLIDVNKNDGFIIRGQELVPSYKDNALIMKIDYDGNIIWDKIFGTESTLTRAFKIINLDDSYLIFGMHSSNLWILKLDINGTKIWEKEIQYSKNNMYYYTSEMQNKYIVYSINTQLKKQTIKVSIDAKGNFTKEDAEEIPVKIRKERNKHSFYSKVINQNLYTFVKDKEYYIVQKNIDSKVDWEYKIKKEEKQSTRSDIKVLETKDGGCIILHVFLEAPRILSTVIIKLDKQGAKIWEKHFKNSTITNGKEIKKNQFVFIGNNFNTNAKMETKKNTVKFSMSTSNKKAVLIFLNQSNI